jgi:hypothetical protein
MLNALCDGVRYHFGRGTQFDDTTAIVISATDGEV